MFRANYLVSSNKELASLEKAYTILSEAYRFPNNSQVNFRSGVEMTKEIKKILVSPTIGNLTLESITNPPTGTVLRADSEMVVLRLRNYIFDISFKPEK